MSWVKRSHEYLELLSIGLVKSWLPAKDSTFRNVVPMAFCSFGPKESDQDLLKGQRQCREGYKEKFNYIYVN